MKIGITSFELERNYKYFQYIASAFSHSLLLAFSLPLMPVTLSDFLDQYVLVFASSALPLKHGSLFIGISFIHLCLDSSAIVRKCYCLRWKYPSIQPYFLNHQIMSYYLV